MVNVLIIMTSCRILFCSWNNLLTPVKINIEVTGLALSVVPSLGSSHMYKVERERESRVPVTVGGDNVTGNVPAISKAYDGITEPQDPCIRSCDPIAFLSLCLDRASYPRHNFSGILTFSFASA